LGNRTPPHNDALAGDTGHLIVDGRARKCWGDWFVGGGCRSIYFFCKSMCALRSAASSVRDTRPADAIVGTGRVGRGRGGGGVLLARVTASFLGEGTRRVTMEIAPLCGAIYCIFGRGGSIFTPWGHQTTGFCDVVARARAADSPVRLRRQNPERDLASWRNISHRGQFRRRWCLTKLVREGDLAGFGSPVSSVRNV
jgi:hypothetical protein